MNVKITQVSLNTWVSQLSGGACVRFMCVYLGLGGVCPVVETPITEQSANESTRDPPNTFDCDAVEERGAVQSLAGLSIS